MSEAMMKNRAQATGITLQHFLDGKQFTYHGHFGRIAHKEFRYDAKLQKDIEILKIWKYNVSSDNIVNHSDRESWDIVGLPSPDKICVRTAGFGNVIILFKECQLVEGAAA